MPSVLSTENNTQIESIFSKIKLPRHYITKFLLYKINYQTNLLEQIAWEYLCHNKLQYLIKKFNITQVNKIHPSAITKRHIPDYCIRGEIKISEEITAHNYYGLIKSDKKIAHFICDKNFFDSILEASENFNLHKAIYLLRFIDKDLCAANYKFFKFVGLFAFMAPTAILLNFNLLALSVCILSATQSIFKILLTKNAMRFINRTYVPIEIFPIYTILIPIYSEPNRINFIIKAISEIHYPKNRLEVKLVIEDDDFITQKELNLAHLPKYFHVIKVPASKPRTKPKALNYAAQYISGDYVTIFDAEDYPEPNQLIKALHNFQKLDDRYVCLQAKLNFYNKNENMLTAMQSIEYSIWFEYLLQGLANTNQFIPLGGTSCHFKTNALRKLGYWDPFNVTEDLDLGIRLYLKGYRTHIIDSITLEEAIINIMPWLQQRTRWIKGFIQSYIVFCYNRNKFNLTIGQKLVIDFFVGLSILNFLIPIYFLIGHNYNNYLIQTVVISNSILGLIYLLISAQMATKKHQSTNANNMFNLKQIFHIICFPFYFILHTIAAYMAMFQLITAPFKWNKTQHGLSKIFN